ncbi:MAG: 3-dehydroquinate synthase [Erysipelotrichales bacterium]|nr:3-dehydroquinate synthase [Erysipelotrichales bacterium]
MQLHIQTSTHTYPIYLQKGILSSLSSHVDLERKIIIITDTNIPTQYIQTVQQQCTYSYVYTCQSGEEAKSFAVYEDILRVMLDQHFSRKDAVIALGGGVIGDLAGFVAATYMRGIDFINIPTTTLSQIDSSIGGKVAINVDSYKNMVGAFYPPIAVFIDPNTLQTLPTRHYYNGLVEALKAGLIYNKELVTFLGECDVYTDIEKIIYEALLVKKEVVEKDEFESNLRKILNFGHTIGHGLESYYGLQGLLHGEAVALGMWYSIEDESIKEVLRPIYSKLQQRTSIQYDPKEVYNYILNDKKANNTTISYVTLSTIGEAKVEEIELPSILTRLEDKVWEAHMDKASN